MRLGWWPSSKVLATSAVLLTAAILVVFGLAAYPLMRTDAPAYLTPALNHARGEGLTNTLFSLLPLIDPGLRLVYHGFLQQQLLGAISPSPEGYWALLLSQIGNAASVILLGLYLHGLAQARDARPHWSAWAAIVLACAATAAMLATKLGRPETFALLIVLLVLLAARGHPRHEVWIIGLGLGLLGATTPIVAVVIATLVVAYFGVGRSTPAALGAIALSAVVAIAVLAALLVFIYPYRIDEWLRGLIAHSQYSSLNSFFSGGYVAHYLLNEDFPFFVFTLLLTAGVTAVWLRLNWVDIKSKWIFAGGVAIFALMMVGHCLAWGDRVYTWFPLLPMVYAPLVCLLAPRPSSEPLQRLNRSGVLRLAAVAALALPALGFARLVVMYGWFEAYGMSYRDAREAVNAIYAGEPGKIRISDSMFVLFDDLQRLEVQRPESDPARINTSYLTGRPYDLLILQENLSGQRVPPPIEGYALEEDRFTHLRPTFLSIPIANTMAGYQFAVYRRAGGAPTSAATSDRQ